MKKEKEFIESADGGLAGIERDSPNDSAWSLAISDSEESFLKILIQTFVWVCSQSRDDIS